MLSVLVLALTVVSVTARYTVPVPIHYEIETQFQRQSGVRNMRWDPTNYLTYLAAVYSQCTNLYDADGARTAPKSRVPNATAYANLFKYFDPSLLQNNLIVLYWDIESQERQDSGSVDRDIRRITGRANGQGALQNFPSFDMTVKSYDRFGCSVETACKEGGRPVMTLVCIFGQSVPSKQTSGTGETPTQRPPTQPTTRPTPIGLRTTTTRPRPRPPTTTTMRAADVILGGGLYETYQQHSLEFYESISNELLVAPPTESIVSVEQQIVNASICQYENRPTLWATDKLKDVLNAQLVLYGAPLSPRPTEADLRAVPISDVAKSALRSALNSKLTDGDDAPANTIACAWALCQQNYMVGCALLQGIDYADSSDVERV